MCAFNAELSALGIDSDQEKLFAFCRVMVRSSIDLTLQRGGEGQTQNVLLDYRYIDSFVKLVVVLLKTFDFNK
jgi:hypothetical protein